MLSKNKQKLLRQLASKKHRDELGLFIAEGPKVVGDLLGKMKCHLIFGTHDWLVSHLDVQADEVFEITQAELEKASLLKTPRDVIGVFYMKNDVCGTAENYLSTNSDYCSTNSNYCGTNFDGLQADAEGETKALSTAFSAEETSLLNVARRELVLALDGVQDPGNLGTIIRLADWFGISHIICSMDTADAYSPKTVMATMGAIARVRVHYVDLPRLLAECGADVPVYGTFLDGTDIYAEPLSAAGVVVMGNEGNGISDAVAQSVNRRLFIPSFPADRPTSESLNVAIATAITCAEFRRRMA